MDRFDDDIFEPWSLKDDKFEEVRLNALAISTFLYLFAKTKESKDRMWEIGNDIYDCDNIEDLKDSLKLVSSMILETETTVEDNDDEWLKLYMGLFGSSPYAYESHYSPAPGEMPALTRRCIRDGVRVKLATQDGVYY